MGRARRLRKRLARGYLIPLVKIIGKARHSERISPEPLATVMNQRRISLHQTARDPSLEARRDIPHMADPLRVTLALIADKIHYLRTSTITPSSAQSYSSFALSVVFNTQPYVTGLPRLFVQRSWAPPRLGKPWKPFIKSEVGTGR